MSGSLLRKYIDIVNENSNFNDQELEDEGLEDEELEDEDQHKAGKIDLDDLGTLDLDVYVSSNKNKLPRLDISDSENSWGGFLFDKNNPNQFIGFAKKWLDGWANMNKEPKLTNLGGLLSGLSPQRKDKYAKQMYNQVIAALKRPPS